MADLKPLGSEKLTGIDKINRILEISKYKETIPNSINESNKSEYKITLSDGNEYQIIKEKMGYIIKRTISESDTEYISPMQDRKYFNSYSQALKKINLMAKEMNELYDNKKGTSLFFEQKKFILKTPKPAVPAPLSTDDIENVPVPPINDDMGAPIDDMDVDNPIDTQIPNDDLAIDDTGLDSPESSEPSEPNNEDVSFKVIQKLVGKVSQKLRTLDSKDELTNEDAKYVINSILSAIDLSKLDAETVEEILSKFDQDETDVEMDIDSEDSDDEFQIEDEPETTEMTETWSDFAANAAGLNIANNMQPFKKEMGEEDSLKNVANEMFSEAKIGKIISNYFNISNSENKFEKEINKKRINENSQRLLRTLEDVEDLSLNENQYNVSKKLLKDNPNLQFIGRTNKNNLVFESKDKQYRITPKGRIL
jgi:hypothetical protein